MKCPCCGAAELIHDTRDMPYVYKGESTTIPTVTGDFCPACGEVVLNREHGDRYSELLGAFAERSQRVIPPYGPGRIHPKAASGHGCITVLLLTSVEIGGITTQLGAFFMVAASHLSTNPSNVLFPNLRLVRT